MLNAIEEEMQLATRQAAGQGLGQFNHMLAYHLGWEGEDAGPEARGKRIRPLLVLLTCAACCGEWPRALPAGAAVELVHNFSLIHDDIQDNSPTRRGRPTVWRKWGIAQAINAGDAMLTLAHLGLLRLEETVSAQVALQATHILQQACLLLTEGQYLDLAYEAHGNLSLDSYWHMVSGKTAALLSVCTELGALAAGASESTRVACRQFGYSLGLAFQAQDDILGIWGNAALTGKSAESDLVAGKKSLPIVFGIQQNGSFADRWSQGPIQPEEVPQLAAQLEVEGGRDFAMKAASDMTRQSLESLEQANPQGEAGRVLTDLAHELLGRQA
jgi:geranylgeranyl diphosphate synthase type I